MKQLLVARHEASNAFSVSKEEHQAMHFARTLLEIRHQQMKSNPELGELELYKQVLYKAYGYSDDLVDHILECAAEDSPRWVDDTGEALIFRDIVYHLLFRDPISFRRHPETMFVMANIVEESIPADI